MTNPLSRGCVRRKAHIMATQTTSIADYAWRPDVSTFVPGDVVPQSLYLTCTTTVGTIQGDEPSLHVAYCDDDDATVVAEGADIPEGDHS